MPNTAKLSEALRTDISDSIRNAVSETFETLFGTHIDSCRKYSGEVAIEDTLFCRADLHQEGLVATLYFSFDKGLLRELMKDIYSPELLEVESIFDDAASEIANIVCTNVKAFLNENGFHLAMEIPYVFDSYNPIEGDAILLHFTLRQSDLYVDFVMNDGVMEQPYA